MGIRIFWLTNGNAVATILVNDVFLVFGVPRVIICDNGPQYLWRQFPKLPEGDKCQVEFNVAYYPRANPTESQSCLKNNAGYVRLRQ